MYRCLVIKEFWLLSYCSETEQTLFSVKTSRIRLLADNIIKHRSESGFYNGNISGMNFLILQGNSSVLSYE